MDLARDTELCLRRVNTGSDLVTNVDIRDRDIVGNIEARVYLQHHLESESVWEDETSLTFFADSHSRQQQQAEKRWSKLERNKLAHFHSEELFLDKVLLLSVFFLSNPPSEEKTERHSFVS